MNTTTLRVAPANSRYCARALGAIVACLVAGGGGVAMAGEDDGNEDVADLQAEVTVADASGQQAQPAPFFAHVPPNSFRMGEALQLAAVIELSPGENWPLVRYRSPDAQQGWSVTPFEVGSNGGYYATIPASAAQGTSLEYFISGRDAEGKESAYFASSEAPHRIPGVDAAQLGLGDLGGRRDALRLGFHGHNFGNRYGVQDNLVRGELAWTHYLGKSLYAITLGYGLIGGVTPSTERPPMAGAPLPTETNAAHLSFVEARLRLAPGVFVDGRATMGVSRRGFMRGIGGTVTFGNPWHANLAFSAEALEDLGATMIVRLQWDTVPPLLMGASVVKTDLPGAVLTGGLFLKYDVAWRFHRQLGLNAALSYGSRDGEASFGGGAGTVVWF